jgi:arsenite methyltransferase
MLHYLDRHIDYLSADITEAYDELPFWSAPFGLLLQRELPMLRSGAVLDVGCGTGFPLTVLAARFGPGVTLTGIDPWENAVARARRKITAYGLEHAHVVTGDACVMPFEAASFDLVTANLALNNVPDIDAFLQECHRVLKPGGRACFTTNLQGTFQEVYTLIVEALAFYGEEVAMHQIAQHAAARMNMLQVRDRLEAAGLAASRTQSASNFSRWSCGAAFLNDPFIIMGFLQAWKKLVPAPLHKQVFAHLERGLDHMADTRGAVTLSVPMLYIEGAKSTA